jgi:hypothetical protein
MKNRNWPFWVAAIVLSALIVVSNMVSVDDVIGTDDVEEFTSVIGEFNYLVAHQPGKPSFVHEKGAVIEMGSDSLKIVYVKEVPGTDSVFVSTDVFCVKAVNGPYHVTVDLGFTEDGDVLEGSFEYLLDHRGYIAMGLFNSGLVEVHYLTTSGGVGISRGLEPGS